MSKRVSRVGTADKPTSVEQNVGRLEVKMKEMELKTGLKEKEKGTERNKMIETVELFKSQIRDIKDDIMTTGQRIENLLAAGHEEKTELGETTFRFEETIQQLNNKVERVANALENVQEKMYDFEANKKDYLIFMAFLMKHMRQKIM